MKSQEGRRLCGRCARRAGGTGGFLFLNGLCNSNLPFHDLERNHLGYFRRPDQGKIGDLADGTSVIRSLIVRGGDQGGASEQNNGQQRNGGLHLPMGYSPDGATTEHIPINTLVDLAGLVNGLVSAARGLLWFISGLGPCNAGLQACSSVLSEPSAVADGSPLHGSHLEETDPPATAGGSDNRKKHRPEGPASLSGSMRLNLCNL